MEFLPDTQAALNEYLSLTDPDLAETLAAMGSSATRIVPDCVGLSLCLYTEDLTFTLVASNLVLAELDAMQYLDGGPCVDAVEENRGREESVPDMLDEERWQLFARASAAAGVASTLSLPILADGRVMGGINLYASTTQAFVGHHQELADALGASAVGAVTNADLAFHSRERAARAPAQLRDQQITEVAVGIIAARDQLEIETARSHSGTRLLAPGSAFPRLPGSSSRSTTPDRVDLRHRCRAPSARRGHRPRRPMPPAQVRGSHRFPW